MDRIYRIGIKIHKRQKITLIFNLIQSKNNSKKLDEVSCLQTRKFSFYDLLYINRKKLEPKNIKHSEAI